MKIFDGHVWFGPVAIGFKLTEWRVCSTRGATTWAGRLGPLSIRRAGLHFSQNAVASMTWLDEGSVQVREPEAFDMPPSLCA